MKNRLNGAFSYQNNQTESADNQSKVLLPDKTIIKTVDEKIYRSIEEENNQENPVQNVFDTPTKGILLPWNLQTSWKREDNLLFYIAAFNLGIHPRPLLMDLSRPLDSGMVVEDQGSMEGVILEFLETYNNGTTTILCSLNKQYGLPDKLTSNQRLQFVSHKPLTTNTTHHPEKNGITERINCEIWKLFLQISEYNKKPRMTHKSAQQILKGETFSEESKKSSIFRNHRPELLNNWRIHPIIHTSLPTSYEENDPLEENFFRPLPESTKEEYEI